MVLFGAASLFCFVYGVIAGQDGSGYIVAGIMLLFGFISNIRTFMHRNQMSEAGSSADGPIRQVGTDDELEKAIAAEKALIYKHSPTCPISRAAFDQVIRFAKKYPTVPIHMIDVVRQRGLSQSAAKKLAIRHESPQAIVVTNGKPVWNASHYEITVDALAAQLV